MRKEVRSFIGFGAVQLTVTDVRGDKKVLVQVTNVAPGTNEGLKSPREKPFEIPMWENELRVFVLGGELIYEALPRKVGLEVGDVVHALINFNDHLDWICVIGVVADDDYLRVTKNLPTESLVRKIKEWELHRGGSRHDSAKNSNLGESSGVDSSLALAFKKTEAQNDDAAGQNDSLDEDDGPRRADVVSVEDVPDIRGGLRHRQPARRHQQQRPNQRSQAA